MVEGEPTPLAERPRTNRRFRWLGWAALAILLVGAAAMLRYRKALLAWTEEAGHRLAGIGELAWEDPEGDWHEVGTADAHRRLWGPTDAFLTPAWRTVATGLEVADLEVARAPNPLGVTLALVRVAPRGHHLGVYTRPGWEERAVDPWARELSLSVAVNASYFSEEGPIGLVLSDGRRLHRQASRRAAHFLVDGPGFVPRIVNARGADLGGVSDGFQGFPSIMSHGRTYSYMRTGGRGFDVLVVERRAAACVDRRDRLVLLVTDTYTNGLTLDELATVLGGLGCVDAMGLDGGGSAALSVHVPGHDRVVTGTTPVQVILGVEPVEARE